ncbi:MAG TPA: L-histidine N(alpha)-methyltransferase [Acidiferrobacteraceae bacterium]|nr:L-histidine N(alpha)-methyltransferase [Acidiferrobacteraceae bacterium]
MLLSPLPAKLDDRVFIRRIDDADNPQSAVLANDVRLGLCANPKTLPPKYFYDERGSQLFENICTTAEYYPTRTEDALLKKFANQIIQIVQPDSIVELGSGSSRKTAHIFSACSEQGCHSRYQPVDVCAEILVESAKRLIGQHGWLHVDACVGDYCQALSNLPASNGHRLFLFFGGTIGNFKHDDALAFLRDLRVAMRPDDWFLLGADRVKDVDVLNAAYNDADGHTAAFNLNVLEVINRELGGDFDADLFVHSAFYNRDKSRIEMHLRARKGHTVNIRGIGIKVNFRKHETILTEISRKFTPQSLTKLLTTADFTVHNHFVPENGYYSLMLVRPQ